MDRPTGQADGGGAFVRARITRYYTLEEKNLDRRHIDGVSHVLDETHEIDRLASFFPKIGEMEAPSRAGGWIAFARIDFITAMDTVFSVTVDPDLEEWSEGAGDWPLSPDFAAYFLAILREQIAAGGER